MTAAIETTADLRRKAADLIEERGWWQDLPGQPERAEGEFANCPICMVEALAMAGGRSSPTAAALMELRKELGTSNLVDWQDTLGRTEEEVLAALRGRQS